MENGTVILADCPRGEAGQVNRAVQQSLLTIYTLRLLLFISLAFQVLVSLPSEP